MSHFPPARQLKKLSEICDLITDGSHFSPKTIATGYPYITVKDVDDCGNIDLINCKKVSEKDFQNLLNGNCAPKIGDILLSKDGTVGKVALVDRDGFVVLSSLAILRPSKSLNNQYLKYFLKSPEFIELAIASKTGAAIKRIVLKTIKEFKLPLPPLATQHKIVTLLDQISAEITASRTAIQSQLDHLDELWTSSLSESMGNNIGTPTKLGSLCNFVRGPFGGSLKKEIFKPDGYAIYEQQHAIYNQFSEIRYFIDEEKFNEMKRFELKSGDLIMSCSGTMGKIAIVPHGIKQGIINQALLKLTPGEKINSKFLKLWMQSENFQNSLQEYSQGAAIQNVASVAILKQIQIPLPSLEIQTSIVSQLDQVSQTIGLLRTQYTAQLQHYDELWASVLDQAFRGELVAE